MPTIGDTGAGRVFDWMRPLIMPCSIKFTGEQDEKILLSMLAIIMVFTGVFSFTACTSTTLSPNPEEKHEHAFSTEWTSDEENHWHRCTGCTANTLKE